MKSMIAIKYNCRACKFCSNQEAKVGTSKPVTCSRCGSNDVDVWGIDLTSRWEPSDCERFEGIFQKAGLWLMGPGIIGDLVLYLKNKSICVEFKSSITNRANIIIPKPFGLIETIPEELRGIFIERLNIAIMWSINANKQEAADIINGFIGRNLTISEIHKMNSELQRLDEHRRAQGQYELWRFVSDAMGFPFQPPTPAGIFCREIKSTDETWRGKLHQRRY